MMTWKEQKGDLTSVFSFSTFVLSCDHGDTELFVMLCSLALPFSTHHLSGDCGEEDCGRWHSPHSTLSYLTS